MFDPLDNIMVGTKYLYMLSNIKMMSHLLLPPIMPVREMDKYGGIPRLQDTESILCIKKDEPN